MQYEKSKRIINKLILIVTAGAVLFNISCVDQYFVFDSDSSLFKELAYDILQTTAPLDSSAVVLINRNAGLEPYLILGEYRNSRCSILMKFDELPSSITVESAVITLSPRYVFGENPTEFTGTLHEIESDWSEDYIPDVLVSDPLSNFTIHGDTTSVDSIIVPSDLVQHWIDVDTLNYGLFLSFETAGFAKQFYARQNESVTVISIQYMQGDSLVTAQYTSTMDSYLYEGTTLLDEELFVTNYGPHELAMKFDIGTIPDYVTINLAELVLFPKTGSSILGPEEEYIFTAAQIVSESWLPDTVAISSDNVQGGTFFDNMELRIPVTSILQRWVTKTTNSDGMLDNPNYGLMLVSMSEKYDLSEFVFHSSVFEPYIEVSYTQFNPVK